MGATSKDVWKTGTTGAYAALTYTYERKLEKGHIYYYRCTYKYTTTNQSPTWAAIYSQGGYTGVLGAKVNNPVAGQEYTLSGYATTIMTSPVDEAVVYNGEYDAIKGVTASVKNFMAYDVTGLWNILKNTGAIQNNFSALVAWCDANLEYVNNGVNYDVTDLVANLTKVTMGEGNICCEPVECDGMEFYSYSDRLRQNTYFDNGVGIYVYNNIDNGTVTHTRIDAKSQDSPFYPEHKYILQIKTNGTAQPSCGGFHAEHAAGKNKIFIEKFVAKIPVGYNITIAYNPQGDGALVTYLTPRAGTGKWEEYAVLYKCGTSGTFSTGGHIYLSPDSGYSATSVTWYLAYVNNCDITDNEELKNYTVLPNKDIIKGNKVFSKEFNTANFMPNGTFTDNGMELPDGWTYDDTDYAGNAKRSIVQPVGVGFCNKGICGKIKITPNTKYKLSFWVKCKGDMTSFLTAIYPYTSDNILLEHGRVIFTPGTETTLTADLVDGATQMTVANNANWVVKDYSALGFRTWNTSYNTEGEFWNSQTGVVSGVSGSTIVNFKLPYKGNTMKKGTYVVESYAGNNYPYPIFKEDLPKDNTWKYVEGYFGDDTFWRGSSAYGWLGLPVATDYIEVRLNIYNNNGTVPIKFSDIRLEQVGKFGDGERYENKIQFKKHN
jgi:hypothetical protein